MGLDYKDLNAAVRAAMVSEIRDDIAAQSLYVSPRLTPAGASRWPALLLEAADRHDDAWLATQLPMYLRQTELSKSSKGTTFEKAVPTNAHETLAEGEFNRYYMRGLCVVAVASGKAVQVYRGKEVATARSESTAMLGKLLAPHHLLDDLRRSIGTDTALGLPPGPNSGLTIRIK